MLEDVTINWDTARAEWMLIATKYGLNATPDMMSYNEDKKIIHIDDHLILISDPTYEHSELAEPAERDVLFELVQRKFSAMLWTMEEYMKLHNTAL
jgi:hypothetical protein